MLIFVFSLLLYFSSVLMIFLILMQPHKSEGLTASRESTIFGVSIDGGPLAKITAVLAGVICLIILGMHYFV